MSFVKLPKDLSKESVKEVGGKAANLAELINSGFPVPECFFITVAAYEEFIAANRLKEKIEAVIKEINFSDVSSIEEASKKIKHMILSAPMPNRVEHEIATMYKALVKAVKNPFVAVRSSAVTEDVKGASSAGQQETFLNVSSEEQVLESVKKCWASLFTARAVYYRYRHNQSKTPGISVIVQRMIESKKSGIIFTVNPSNPEKKNITIEACWGLGETIVQGEVIPDRYIVDRTGKILEIHIGKKVIQRLLESGATVKKKVPEDMIDKQVLSNEEILALAEYAKRIEEHYKVPQDIEYGIDDRIYILQSRAVTFLESRREETSKSESEILVRGLVASPGVATGTVKIVKNISEAGKVRKGDILVTEMTSPDFVPVMEKSAAIVTDRGGATCHAAIVSRELGIPCIVGTTDATHKLKEGSIVTVDAFRGVVYKGAVKIEEKKKISTGEKTKTKVKLNIAFPSTARAELAARADGVGLLRTEHMLTEKGMHPVEYIRSGNAQELIDILVQGVGRIAEIFRGKPVWMRSLDARTDEYRHMKGGEKEPKEDNPMLGWHGIRRSLDEPKILECEFSAIKTLHEKGLTNVALMLPFVINVSELRKAKELAKRFNLPGTVKFGIMVETPAAALTIEEFCREGIDFISFGSNDLSQLVLGVDRNNERLTNLFDEMHPAMLKLFEMVIKTCKKYNVETSICGEAASKPEVVKKLLEFGIDSVSCNIDALDKIRQTVAEYELR